VVEVIRIQCGFLCVLFHCKCRLLEWFEGSVIWELHFAWFLTLTLTITVTLTIFPPYGHRLTTWQSEPECRTLRLLIHHCMSICKLLNVNNWRWMVRNDCLCDARRPQVWLIPSPGRLCTTRTTCQRRSCKTFIGFQQLRWSATSTSVSPRPECLPALRLAN